MNLKYKDILAAFFILSAPLLNHIYYLKYDIFSPEIAFIFAVVFLISFLLFFFIPPKSHILHCIMFSIILFLFIDFQSEIILGWGKRIPVIFLAIFGVLWAIRQHSSTILLTMFITINLVTAALYYGPALVSLNTKNVENSITTAPNLPITVHIVLDEHIGIEGIPTDIPGGEALSHKLRSFYQTYGFYLYGSAYSEYFETKDSISNMFNFKTSLLPQQFYKQSEIKYSSGFRYSLTSNPYFQKMQEQGHRIKIYQSSYLDFCQEGELFPETCMTYDFDTVPPESLSSLTTFQKADLISRLFLRNSFFANEFMYYISRLNQKQGQADNEPAKPARWDGRVGPLPVMPAFNALIKDIKSDSGKVLYFAHMLSPHYPYVYDRYCKIRVPISSWKGRITDQDEQRRKTLYPLYFEQVECTLLQMEELFETLKSIGKYSDATIIIHGDHGSRITLHDPLQKASDVLSDQDMRDSYSTLFAFKAPGQEARYSQTMHPIRRLLENVIYGRPLSDEPAIENKVFLTNSVDNALPKTLPNFTNQID